MNASSPAPSALDSNSICCETLERLGELRPDRINNPKYVRNTVWIYAPLIGGLGILSGYTLYFTLEPIVHGEGSARTLFLELLIASAMVAILEWVKGVIQYGTKRLLPSRQTLAISIFTVVLFEILILAAHNLPGDQPAELQRILQDIGQGTWIDFATLALLWMIIGAALTREISKAIFGRVSARSRDVWSGAVRGVAAGLVAAGMVLAYLVVVRVIWVTKVIAIEHPKWHGLLNKHPKMYAPARALDYLLDNVRPLGPSVPFGLIIIAVLVILSVYWSWKSGSWKPFGWLSVVTMSVLVLPVADVDSVKLPLQVLIAWSVPGALLGATVSWLRPGTRLPGFCAAGALLTAFALSGLGIYYIRSGSVGAHGRGWLMLIPVVALVATSIEIIIKKEIQEYWPLAALSIAIFICLITTPILLGRASFSGILKTLNGLTPQGSFSTMILGTANLPPDQTGNPSPSKYTDEPADVILSQLCITGSLSFWVSVGLLIGWSIRETHERTSLYSDGKMRCFWVREGWKPSLEYHDLQHGVFPKNDRDLFTHLSLELLTNGSPWANVSAYTQVFEGFIPEKVARMSAVEVRKQVQKAKPPRFFVWTSSSWASNRGVESVIENAKRLQTFYGKQAETTLIRALQLEAARGPEAAVRFFRSMFEVRRDFAVGSFLQATGVLPGAHFHGCWRCPMPSARTESSL